MTSITLGLVIVFSLEDSGAVSVTQNTLSPAADFVLGLIALVVARVLSANRDEHLEERREKLKVGRTG